MHRLHAPYLDLSERLRALRDLLSAPQRLRYFDQSLDANEFGEALHALCDFLLEPVAPPVSVATLGQIEELHNLMRIEDDCVERLRQKASLP